VSLSSGTCLSFPLPPSIFVLSEKRIPRRDSREISCYRRYPLPSWELTTKQRNPSVSSSSGGDQVRLYGLICILSAHLPTDLSSGSAASSTDPSTGRSPRQALSYYREGQASSYEVALPESISAYRR
jgi:hypothetical protein